MSRRFSGVALALVVLVLASTSTALAGNLSGSAKNKKFTVTPLNVLSTGSGLKSTSGQMAESSKRLLSRTDSARVPVMIKLDYDAVASYRGTIKGLSATSPSVTGRRINSDAPSVKAYTAFAAGMEHRVLTAIKARIPQAQLLQRFRNAYGGVSIVLPANRAKDLLAIDGVAAVQADKLQHPLDNKSPHFIGADRAWPSLGGRDNAGKGVVLGVLDTGIWPEHPALRDRLPDPRPGQTFGCQFGDGTDPDLGPRVTCNDKLLGAYAFTDTYMAVVGAGADEFCDTATGECSARDSEGHGTHTLTTAAGDHLKHAKLFGVDRGPFNGIAPGASVIAYRVCLEAGCFNGDSVAAINRAITDGVDVINFSISGGVDPYSDPVELAFLDAFEAGITVSTSAGNEGPGAGTVNHNSPWLISTGASTWNGQYKGHINLTADNGDTRRIGGASITNGLSPAAPVVRAEDVPGYTDPLCQTALPSGSATGDIVACERGVNARVDKGYNVRQGGAVGMILYNPINEDLETDNHWVPTVHIDGDQGVTLLNFLAAHTGVMATFDTPVKTHAKGDVMATFSSKGPGTDWIKPDLTAPGIQIFAGHTPQPASITNGPPGKLFQAIAGTSMSSPHSAGDSLLIKAAHPGWSPAQIKSAQMLTATSRVVKEDRVTHADPFDMGAGRIRVNKGVHSPLTMNESGPQFAASEDDSLHRLDLNVASVDVPAMPGKVTTTRTVKNTTGRRTTFRVTTTSTAGSITVSPSKFTLKRGAKRTLKIVIKGERMGDGDQAFGQIKLNPNTRHFVTAKMPVAFTKSGGQVAMSHTCAPKTIAIGERTHCTVAATNLAQSDANISLKVSSANPKALKIKHWSSGTATKSGFSLRTTLGPAAAPTVDSITAGGTGLGYIPLVDLGIPPLDGMGDETFANLGTSTYDYGSEPYNSVFVDSNGYAAPGTWDASSNECCNIQDFPDPSLPNNTLAAYWTDLNADPSVVGTDGGIYAAEISDGVNTWVVVDWHNVPIFGTTQFENFEIWLQTEGGDQAQPVTYEYGTIDGDVASTGGNWGAENRDGTSGVNFGPPATGEEYDINTSPPTPGGTFTVHYRAKGKMKGRHALTAKLYAPDIQRGIALKTKHIQVTR